MPPLPATGKAWRATALADTRIRCHRGLLKKASDGNKPTSSRRLGARLIHDTLTGITTTTGVFETCPTTAATVPTGSIPSSTTATTAHPTSMPVAPLVVTVMAHAESEGDNSFYPGHAVDYTEDGEHFRLADPNAYTGSNPAYNGVWTGGVLAVFVQYFQKRPPRAYALSLSLSLPLSLMLPYIWM